MTLTELFAAIQNASTVLVKVTELDSNEDEVELARVYANGYEQLLTTTLSRTVSKITIVSVREITVQLAAAV